MRDLTRREAVKAVTEYGTMRAARDDLICGAYRAGLRMSEIASFMGLNRATVSKILNANDCIGARDGQA